MSVAYMNRAQRGLYHGIKIQYGNNVGFSNLKTRRTWKPNVQKVALYSEMLEKTFNLPVTAYALRIITKYGGLDNYLLFNKDEEIDSEVGFRLKQELIPLYLEKTGQQNWNQSSAIYQFRQKKMAEEAQKKVEKTSTEKSE